MTSELRDSLDSEFEMLIAEITLLANKADKYHKIRVQSWVNKLEEYTNKVEWKKNRNLHAIWLLDMLLNEKLEEPYNKFAKENEPLPLLNKPNVFSKISRAVGQYTNERLARKGEAGKTVEEPKQSVRQSRKSSMAKLSPPVMSGPEEEKKEIKKLRSEVVKLKDELNVKA